MTRQVTTDTTRAWVDIDLGALRHNGAVLAARAGAPLLPMVKADAYGLGAVRVARALEALEPWGFGVGTVAEGMELRDAGIERPIVVFTPLLPEDLAGASQARLTPTLGAAASIACWARLGGPWHLAIDTGMNRAGVRWDEVDALRDALAACPPEGAFTHFHSADRNDGTIAEQEQRFDEAIARLPVRPTYLHVENAPALERRRGSRWSFARPGVFLYGVGSGEGAEVRPRPVAHLRARVVELRDVRDGETVSYARSWRAIGDRRIATRAIGYADGYCRALSNRGCVLVNGCRAPVAGLVTMDMTMVDVTGVPCAVGDVATLIGGDESARLDVETVARTADMSPYELLTLLRGRLARVYHDAGAA
ncbi:MAG TPA: alanine racemase [Gemmatimonadaceae bacterium]|nr:alanine racemase [Gemmatimonadaceae bacterium]